MKKRRPPVIASDGQERDVLVNAGYKGWVTLEHEEADPKAEIPSHVEQHQDLIG